MHLVLLSGGPDSAVSLKMVLEETNDPVVVLHLCNTSMKRWGYEKLAVEQQTRYFQARYRKFNVEMATVRLPGPCRISDIPLLAPFAAGIATGYGTIHKTWLGVDDDRDDKPAGRGFRIAMAACMLEERHKVPPPTEFFPPLDYCMTKQAVRDYLGEVVWGMTWSCRNPVKGKHCGECYACARRFTTKPAKESDHGYRDLGMRP